MGAYTAEMTGGEWWMGAAQATVIHLVNQVAHKPKMKKASEYDYSEVAIDGKFEEDMNYVLNGEGGNMATRWWQTLSRDWSNASFDDKMNVAMSMVVVSGGRGTRFVQTSKGMVDIHPTLGRISSGKKFPHRNDGTIFRNREGLLPSKGASYYREYVVPTPGINGPGPMRVVTGQGGDIWFTPNHYKSFIRIK